MSIVGLNEILAGQAVVTQETTGRYTVAMVNGYTYHNVHSLKLLPDDSGARLEMHWFFSGETPERDDA